MTATPEMSSAIPELSAAYQKARTSYTLYSSLLFAWQLTGIQFPGAPVTFTSPHAVPWVLLVLVVYFAFRTTIEWWQADPERRKKAPSLLDFGVAHAVGIAAFALYLVQQVGRIQVANQIPSAWLTMTMLGLVAGQASTMLSARRLPTFKGAKTDLWARGTLAIPVFILVSAVIYAGVITVRGAGLIPLLAATVAFFVAREVMSLLQPSLPGE